MRNDLPSAVVQSWMKEIFLNQENLEIFYSRNFGCCSGKSFGENSHFPSTTLLENLVFPCRFRTNLRSKLPISYSTSKKLPTRSSRTSVGSGAERTALLGLEQSEQQCVLDTRRHLPTPHDTGELNNLPEDFSNINCFHFTRCAEGLAYSKEKKNGVLLSEAFSPEA